MTEAIVGIVGALIGAAATLLAVLPQLTRARREAAAAYIEAMAASLLGMAEAFKDNLVPHDHGHAFEGLVSHYERYVGRYVGEELEHDLRRFREVARRAADTDERIATNVLQADDDPVTVAIDLRRLAGDLRAKAASTRVG
jgi:hypothetical protein